MLGLPGSFTAVETTTVMLAPAAIGAAGVKVAVGPLATTLPATAAPAALTLRLEDVSVLASTGSEKVTEIAAVAATALAPAAGEVAWIAGAVVSSDGGDGGGVRRRKRPGAVLRQVPRLSPPAWPGARPHLDSNAVSPSRLQPPRTSGRAGL